MSSIRVNVNGHDHDLDVDPSTPLLEVLRNDLDLRGPKLGCAEEQCYACCVLVDGRTQPSCQLPVGHVDDMAITTIEGIEDLQDFFLEEQAGQCGYCISGMIVAAQGLLNHTRYPSDHQIREALDTNLCRCGVYDRIRRAIRFRIGQPEQGPPWEVRRQEAIEVAPMSTSPSIGAHPDLDSWIAVNPDETITVFSGKVDLGQGISTTLARIAAAELDVPAESIEVVTADTDRTPNEGMTAGSMSTQVSGGAVRHAARAARAALLARAADELGVPASKLHVAGGRITDPSTAASVTYGELQGGRSFGVELGDPLPGPPRRIDEQSRRVDLPDKVIGAPAFLHDITMVDLAHARVLRPPAYEARLVALDDAEVRAMPGVIDVIRDGSFIGVVAEREHQVELAVDALRAAATWNNETRLPDQFDHLRREPSKEFFAVDGEHVEHDDTPGVDPQQPDAIQAVYTRPLTMHGSLGPSAAIAHLDDGQLTVWSSTQGAFVLRGSIAEALDISVDDVRVIHAEGPGCYGHNGSDDAAFDAALLAMSCPGRPIRLAWSRADEHQWEPYGPPMIVEVRAETGVDGSIDAYESEHWTMRHTTRPSPSGDGSSGLLAAWHREQAMTRSTSGNDMKYRIGPLRNAEPPYRVERARVHAHVVCDTTFRTSALRGLGAYTNVFAMESFIDEVAHSAGLDPVEYRLRHIVDPRAAAVIETAAEAGAWGTPIESLIVDEDRSDYLFGRGVAYARYHNDKTYLAAVVEVGVHPTTGLIRVNRAVLAADAGHVVSADGVSNQLEGGCVQSASWTLKESVRVGADHIESRDWDTYPVLRFSESFPVATVLLDRPEQPSLGCGEASQGPTAAAIANAVFDATGVRLRDLPLTPDRVLAAMSPR